MKAKCGCTMKAFDIFLGALLIIGGLNWGLVGIFNFNLVSSIFGVATLATRLIYILIGLAAIYDVVAIKAIWQRWGIHFNRPANT